MKTTNDFFIPDNEVKPPEELDYSRVDEYIRSAEAFSRSTYQSVYIIDYFKQNFLYVSPNPMFLCGLTLIPALSVIVQDHLCLQSGHSSNKV